MSDEIEGTVADLSHRAEGVVKTAQGTIFAPGVLPGERVMLSSVRKDGKIMRSERVRLLDKSAQRVEPPCPIVARCGGCPMMIATYAMQQQFRRAEVEKAIAAVPGAAAITLGWVGTRTVLQYRRRARIAWDAAGGKPRLGFRAHRSDQITDVRSCAVLDPKIDAALAAMRRIASALRGQGEIRIAMGKDAKAAVHLSSEQAQPPELYGALQGLVSSGELAGAALRAGGADVDATWGDPRELRRGADNEPLWGPVAGFSQAHDEINAALARCVLELARPAERDVLELFSGSGNFTVLLAREAKSVLAIEEDVAAAAACRENLKARGLKATVRSEDAESFRPASKPNVVVLDPPRTGAPGACRRIIHAEIREVVYVSCDPPTLARDLGTLGAAGYTITDAVALDMFPQTAHVESVVRLELRK